MTRLRIGSRGSPLALVQSRWTAAEIEKITGEAPEIVVVKTSGDRFQAAGRWRNTGPCCR